MKTRNSLLQVLSPYGNWEHTKGNQIVDELSAEMMKYNSEKLFAKKIPIYFGHPDEKIKPSKCESVGNVEKIFKTKGGIIISAVYNNDAFEKIVNGKITALSPRWEMQKLSGENFRPVRLVSVGLTNNPNIEGCGKIIDIQNNSTKLYEINSMVKKLRKLSQKFSQNALLTKHSLKKIEKLNFDIRKINVARNLKKSGIESPYNKKSQLKKLSKLAKEISNTTGESFLKAFEKVKNNEQ